MEKPYDPRDWTTTSFVITQLNLIDVPDLARRIAVLSGLKVPEQTRLVHIPTLGINDESRCKIAGCFFVGAGLGT
jgi:hypothetical protein